MAKKLTSIRLTDDVSAYLTEYGGSLSSGVEILVEDMKRIQALSALELKGVFTPEEWKGIADSLNGTMISFDLKYNIEVFIVHLQDAEVFQQSFSKFGVDVDALIAKVRMLKAVNIAAIYNRVSRFWDKPVDLDKWASYEV